MDSITGHNVTGVYVNSTDTFYPPGMYDLWVWVTGKIGNISDVSTNVYVFVCNMPKIENKNFTAAKTTIDIIPNEKLIYPSASKTFS
jgi:hypothetical protein